MVEKPTEAELGKAIRAWLSRYPLAAPVVVVPVFNAYDDAVACVASLLANTQPDVPILVVDDASTDDRIARDLRALLEERGLGYARKPANTGFVGSANFAFTWCSPHDVVLVNSDVVLPPGWLERLSAAAYSASTVATATPLTNNGSIVSVPYRNQPEPRLPAGMTVDEVDARVQAASLRLRPLLPVAIGHCAYFRRSALDAVGYFDEAFAPGYGEEVDFSQRAVVAGFSHVLADDLFVFHKGWRSFGQQDHGAKLTLQAAHEQMVNARYPWYRPWVLAAEADQHSGLALAIERARGALLGYRIAIDATRAGGPTTGTQVVTLELIRALVASRQRFGRVSVIVRDGATSADLCGVDKLADEVVCFSKLQNLDEPAFDLIHCPYQLSSPEELRQLRRAARRLVVSQLDCISYSSPAYARSFAEWQQYRAIAQTVFAIADGITFLTQSGAEEASEQGLSAPPERTCVTYVGVDHRLDVQKPAAPPIAQTLSRQPFLLVLGTNFKHKNRIYALRLLRELVRTYGWPGRLVLAGPPVAAGGSEGEEALELARHPEIAARVHYLGSIPAGQKAWLLKKAALVLYPSIREGFGMVPFEAAAAGTPAISSRLASLPEVLGDAVAYLDTLDPAGGAAAVWSLLCDGDKARHQVEAINTRAQAFRWSAVADRTWDFYRQILEMPPRQVAPLDFWAENGRSQVTTQYTIALAEPPAANWPGRLRRAYRIWRKYGVVALLAEVEQYIRWIQMTH